MKVFCKFMWMTNIFFKYFNMVNLKFFTKCYWNYFEFLILNILKEKNHEKTFIKNKKKMHKKFFNFFSFIFLI